MRADPNLQFQFDAYNPPPPSPPPAWLKALSEALSAMAPLLNFVFWGGVIVILLLILYVVATEIIRRWPRRQFKKSPAVIAKPEYRPAAARARALLEEADRLAAEGRFDEAARVLLHRTIEDIERVFVLAIGPGVTSREIAVMEPLSAQGRDVFSGIARAVETSLFGGRALGAPDFAQCRHAYAAFAVKAAPT
jgi:hypothetical protein